MDIDDLEKQSSLEAPVYKIARVILLELFDGYHIFYLQFTAFLTEMVGLCHRVGNILNLVFLSINDHCNLNGHNFRRKDGVHATYDKSCLFVVFSKVGLVQHVWLKVPLWEKLHMKRGLGLISGVAGRIELERNFEVVHDYFAVNFGLHLGPYSQSLRKFRSRAEFTGGLRKLYGKITGGLRLIHKAPANKAKFTEILRKFCALDGHLH